VSPKSRRKLDRSATDAKRTELHKEVDAFWKRVLDDTPDDMRGFYLRGSILRLWHDEKRYVDMFGKRWSKPPASPSG
jgi:DNA topoisomerase IB